MRTIPLTSGAIALVDDVDAELVLAHRWYFDGKYAAANVVVDGRRTKVRMHRLLLSPPGGVSIDHANRDKLDNRRANLRLCTTSQNLANSGRRSGNGSGYKGVSWHREAKKWQAHIQKGRQFHLGLFESAETAARAYDAAALTLFGPFARTNASAGLLSSELVASVG